MFLRCQLAIYSSYNTFTVLALICHIETYLRITDDNQ